MSLREISLGPCGLVRLHADGRLDEIVLRDKAGQCLFHLEQMNEHVFWLRCYSTREHPLDQELVAHLRSTAQGDVAVDYHLEEPYRERKE